MHLTKISITGFRSFKDTEEILLDRKTNVLIGANDHGKTNLLEAIKCLNNDRTIVEVDKNWDLAGDKIPRIQWHFSLGEEEVQSFTAVENQNVEDKKFPVNKSNELVYFREGIGSSVQVLNTPVKLPRSKEPELLSLRPKVELFEAPRSNVFDRVNQSQLLSPQYEFMKGIFILAGIWERRDTIFVQNDVNSKLLDKASKELTRVLRTDWNQGKDLNWLLKHAGTNGDHIEIQIEDPAIQNRYSRPSLKSSGFQSYFLISMIVLARTMNLNTKYIFLFDEPGTYLHPQAQLDLQRTFEIISDKAQIIYTTHSLFLINKNYPERNKVVSKTLDGTKVNQKPFQKNWKSVRDSLGILLSNNFLIAEKTLLVEGPSDILYILNAIKLLKETDTLDIDLNDLSIVDAGDRSNYLAMAKLMLSEGRDLIALLDGDNWGESTSQSLEKICEKEIRDARLKIKRLPKCKSTEGVFADLTTLHEAVKIVSNSLVEMGVRKFKKDLDNEKTDALIKTITTFDNKTLGKTLDDVTKSLFEDEEKLSKLSIALKYEDLVKEKFVQMKISDEAEELLKTIKTDLQLRGERSAESGVFEEVK